MISWLLSSLDRWFRQAKVIQFAPPTGADFFEVGLSFSSSAFAGGDADDGMSSFYQASGLLDRQRHKAFCVYIAVSLSFARLRIAMG